MLAAGRVSVNSVISDEGITKGGCREKLARETFCVTKLLTKNTPKSFLEFQAFTILWRPEKINSRKIPPNCPEDFPTENREKFTDELLQAHRKKNSRDRNEYHEALPNPPIYGRFLSQVWRCPSDFHSQVELGPDQTHCWSTPKVVCWSAPLVISFSTAPHPSSNHMLCFAPQPHLLVLGQVCH